MKDLLWVDVMKVKSGNRKVIALIVLGLLINAISGCYRTTATQTILSAEIKAYTSDPSKSNIPLEAGQTIAVYLQERVEFNSDYLYIVNMVVTSFDSTSVKGNLLDFGHANKYGFDSGVLVEVGFQNIDFISIRTQAFAYSQQTAKEAAGGVGAAVGTAVVCLITIAVFCPDSYQ